MSSYPHADEQVRWFGTLGGRIHPPRSFARIKLNGPGEFGEYKPRRRVIPRGIEGDVVAEIYDDEGKRKMIDTAYYLGPRIINEASGHNLNELFDFRDFSERAEEELRRRCEAAGIEYVRFYQGVGQVVVGSETEFQR